MHPAWTSSTNFAIVVAVLGLPSGGPDISNAASWRVRGRSGVAGRYSRGRVKGVRAPVRCRWRVDQTVAAEPVVFGSSFLRDMGSETRYLLIEYWGEMVVYEKHLADFGDEVTKLEQQRSQLVERMETIGVFTALDVPDRVGPTWSRRSGK